MTFRVEITAEEDIILARQAARKAAVQLGFSLVDQTRITTVVSELARNIFLYSGSGWMEGKEVSSFTGGIGLEFIFKDSGPGIRDIDLIMAGKYSSGTGLGMDLGIRGARRLMDDFKITISPGEGTLIRIVKWLG